MEWSATQARVLKEVDDWLHGHGEQVKRLFGFAGTGKTTLAKHLAANVKGEVLYGAFTGKAAYVMRQKGCIGARTLHSMVYRPAGDGKSAELALEEQIDKLEAEPDAHERLATLRRQLQELREQNRRPRFALWAESPLRNAALLVVDECSMVDGDLGRDLESFGVKILVLGDPAQLPPVAAGGYFTSREPDWMLTEVHRQARESGILRLATDVRETGGYSRQPGAYGADCEVLTRAALGDALQRRVLDADQVLVGRNATRHGANARHRALRGITSPFPVPGDKVVCLRNNRELGLLNGGLWRVHESVADEQALVVDMTVSSEEDGASGVSVVCHAHHFLGKEEELRKMGWRRRDAEEFDYGCALTVHKAQGSQWDDVVLFDESGAFRADARRWLYTGVTRAAQRLLVVP